MSYRVLALKYRPQTFQDVIGQTHVTTTLSNAIASDRVAHAILLTGPRGTGKTTIARVLAKAMNCAEGPTATPCNVCRSCTQITNGNAPDVFEIDGASNNSVDQIRELRSNVTYMPASSPFKIYIIDEVHMLSMAAFNALLKTLEEPPEHVIFIFATTESHKIPITILSRCQRHDLGRLRLSEISDHLHRLCTEEEFTISKESCDLVASEADGSMRDALSLLDRILSSSPDHTLCHDAILNNLGIIDKKMLFDLSAAILSHDVPRLLTLIETVSNLGVDLKKFYGALVRQFRNLAVIRACSSQSSLTDVTDLSDHDIEQIRRITGQSTPLYLTQLLNLLLKEEQLIKFASHTRTALEMVLLKLIQIRPGNEVDELIRKLDAMARQTERLPHQASPPDEPPQSIKSTPQPNTTESPTLVEPPLPTPLPITEPFSVAEPLTPPDLTPSPSKMPEGSPSIPQYIPEDMDVGDSPYPPPSVTAQIDNESPHPPPVAAQIDNESPHPPVAARIDNESSPPPRQRHPESEGAPPPPTKKSWKGLIKAVSQKQKVLATILQKSVFKELTTNELVVELKGTPFELTRMTAKKTELDAICSDYFGKSMAVKIIDRTEKQNEKTTHGGMNTAKLKQEARNHPLVLHAVNLFEGSNIVDVKTVSKSK